MDIIAFLFVNLCKSKLEIDLTKYFYICRVQFICRWVLTAAHCLSNKDTVYAYVGLDKTGTYYDGIEVPASMQHVPSNYVPGDCQPHDIGS